ncbi:hypothetical protein VB775_22165 [Pseudanabaena sp. CCNP1317]|jgi:predicted transposase YdaD|nr:MULTISPECIES: hypothetical protein [Pseudanabaena]MEA5489524.1 hypothetical protein [Pseudanabaena sp. CCNP1317]WGS73381.1 hypothetical protein OA858_04950 [Pseudanabaena galeata CCNP1313]
MIDNVCKFLAESYSTDFASWLLGKPITLTKIEQSELAVEPIRADSVIFLESAEINHPTHRISDRTQSKYPLPHDRLRTITLCHPIPNQRPPKKP